MLKRGVLIVIFGLLSACSLPSQEGRRASTAIAPEQGADTVLGKSLMPLTAKHPGRSGVVPLTDSLDAFAARMLLISKAQHTIDIQYYIWRDDITGNLLLRALHDAAQRNVRVRLLIDDNGTSGLDKKLALLNAEPNVEVRLFNPFPFRAFKQLGFLTDFRRLNRRMHNKSLTVDGQATIVGGRNIGDEYFGATQGVAFADLDVMAVGDIVDKVSQDFDRYWNNQSAYPLEQLVAAPGKAEAQSLQREEANFQFVPKAHAYVEAVRKTALIEDMLAGRLVSYWVPVRMVSDDPDKVLGHAPPEAMLTARLQEILDEPRQTLDLISPYFVPTQQGVEAFAAMARQGVRVRVLTNSMAATDVIAVHAGYAKYRRPLLEQGISLFEMRREADPDRVKEKAGMFGSSGSSLHAKTFAVDGERVFVGSFNFDPRSARLNTELGFVIESEVLASMVAEAFDQKIPSLAYELTLNEKDDIVWLDRRQTGAQALTTEPSSTLWRRLYIDFLSLLPIEPLL